jgi:hypothetical protein
VQWQAWLRHTRPTTPTIQEIIAADQRRLMIQERARQLDEEWAVVRRQAPHLLTTPVMYISLTCVFLQ